MGFLIEMIVEFLGDIAIDLSGMKKEKRKALLDDTKELFRDLFEKRKKK